MTMPLDKGSFISDIRCIKLISAFRMDEPYIDSIGRWNVFGYYDYMDILSVPITAEERRKKSALECIRESARAISTGLSGQQKEHAIYAITHNRIDTINSFWNCIDSFPLVMISIIHAHHQNRSIIELHSKVEQYLIESAQEEIKSIAYLSIDCSDIIIFWATFSFTVVMENVNRICNCEELSIHDMFTICGYSKSITVDINNQGKRELLQKWAEHEAALDSVQIHLRCPSLADAHTIAKELIDSHRQYSVVGKPCLLAGQEDIFVHLQNIPVDDLVSLYATNGALDMEKLYERKVISRTSIGTAQVAVMPAAERSKETLYRYAKKVFERLHELSDHPIISVQSWYAPLCELLNELCSTEVNAASYDIYIQEILSHSVLVDYISSLKQEDAAEITSFECEERIQNYLKGWSQLSFHAMHSEWQLTQTADVNRLYLYPTKLGMLYSSVLYMTANALCYAEAGETKDVGVFFLAPTLTSHPQFDAVYKIEKLHVKLVLGNIPPDMMFLPTMLIPTLVHETAHYIGRRIRCRNRRLESIWNSLLYYSLWRNLILPLSNELTPDQAHRTLINIVSMIEIPISETSIENENYVSNLTKTFVKHNLKKLFREDLDKVIEVFHISVYKETQNVTNTINSWFSVMNGNNAIRPTIDIPDSELDTEYEGLRSIYSEAFADLCMMRLLGMPAEDYLLQIITMYRKRDLDENLDSEIKLARIYATVVVCFGESKIKKLVKHFRKQREKSSNWIYSEAYHIAKSLDRMCDLGRSERLTAKYIAFLVQESIKYLVECNTVLDEIVVSPQVKGLRRVYNTFRASRTLVNENLHELYAECEMFIKSCHEEMWARLKKRM